MKTSLHSSAFALLLALPGALVIGGFTGGCASTPTSESTGQYVDDSVITTKVKERPFGRRRGEVVRDQGRDLQGVVQ